MAIKTFAVVQTASATIKVLHSLARFANADGPDELTGHIIGFHGDRTQRGPPMLVVLLAQKAWQWTKKVKVVNDAVNWATFVQQPGNERKLWTPTVTATEVELPAMLQLPAIVAKYAMSGSRTAKQVFDLELVLAEGNELVNDDVKFVKTWLMAAGQKDSGLTINFSRVDKSGASVKYGRGLAAWSQPTAAAGATGVRAGTAASASTTDPAGIGNATPAQYYSAADDAAGK